jgi:hypothetical protein
MKINLSNIVLDIQTRGNVCPHTVAFLENSISHREYKKLLEVTLNEALLDLSALKEKVLNALATLVVKAQNIGTAILSKVVSVITTVGGLIKKFREKHPTLYRAILIFIVLVIVMVFFASTAKGASSGDPTTMNSNQIDAAIGLLRKMNSGEGGDMVVMKAISYLTDLRDGKIDNTVELGKEAINVANAALSTINKIADTSSSDPTVMKQIYGFAQSGKQVVDAIVSKTDSLEQVKIVLKEQYT